ncbi:hypothetical protein C2G38_2141929 [Gigaspora rosea]|uniref:Mixed lineage kinase domain-containing protein n=1 Tax=Gigaspora rosea TaxID=44941 RepID=A0A397VA41_9GLOM|nr:hypothetical protein C2G38_2141929 [Gigaspora rosea]
MASTASSAIKGAANILSLYFPIIGAVKFVVCEIYQIYENAECNKELCVYMVDRVKTAECSMDKIVRSIEKNKEDFHKKSYYLAFEKFKNILIQIRDFTKSVSKLKGYKKFLNATDVKNKYDHLTKEFDKCMEELHFAIDVSNAMDRAKEAERVDKALEEVEQMLLNLGDKADTIAEDVGFIKAQ